jgi:hypothetical protein
MVLTDYQLDEIGLSVANNIKDNFLYVAFGTGTTPPTSGDIALANEVVRLARQEVTETSDTVTVSGYLDTSSGNGNTIAELGTFQESSGGTIRTRFLLATPIDKTSSKEYWADISIKRTIIEE